MSFGICQHTGKTFVEKFPVNVYEPFPESFGITSQIQFDRAKEIEAAYDANSADRDSWKSGSKRFLFFALNPLPDVNNEQNQNVSKGAFYASPDAVRCSVFQFEHYPKDFRFFVVDPESKDEVLYVAKQMADFRYYVFEESLRSDWWYCLLARHLINK